MKKKKPRVPRATFIVGGNEYKVRYTLPLVRAIRKELDVDILTNAGVNRITGDVISFAEYLWFTIADQAERNEVDEEEFIELLPHTIDQAVDAWLEGICDFFEQLGRSGLAELARALVQTERAEREETNRAMTRKTAEAVVRRQIVMNGKKRRRKMEELLGENDGEGDDEPTPGPTSPN